MYQIAAVVGVIGFLAVGGWAQVPTSGNVFFGYSYLSSDLDPNNRTSLNGWNGSVEAKVLPFIGVVADFSGNYGSLDVIPPFACPAVPCVPPPAVSADISQHNFLFGPRVSFSVGKFRPFAHVLIGASHISESGTGVSTSDTSFADAFGGGLDYHLVPLISWRLQVDALQTRSFSDTQNNVRISTGVVVHF